MRAAFYEQTGPAADVLRVGGVPRPEPGEGEVCVWIHASGVNPSDVKKRGGRMPAPADHPLVIPHSDGAGVIAEVGAGVPHQRIGERVWVWNAQWRRPFGTAAEFCAVPADQAVTLPDGIGFAEGACLGIPAQTARAAVMDGDPGPGRVVLVHGGAGAVGAMAVAIAADTGAHVIATVSSDGKAAIAKAAGARTMIDRHREDIVSAVLDATGGAGADHIVDVDFGANWRVDAASIAVNGSIAAYSAPSAPVFEIDYYAFAARAARLRFVQVYLLSPEERALTIAGLTEMIERGALPVRIGATFPLDEVVAAHEAQESGAVIGNIVIEM